MSGKVILESRLKPEDTFKQINLRISRGGITLSGHLPESWTIPLGATVTIEVTETGLLRITCNYV